MFAVLNEGRWGRPTIIAMAMSAVALIAIVDAETGHELDTSVLYVAPIAFVAWFATVRWASVLAVITAVAAYFAEAASGYSYAHPLLPIWNTAGLLAVLLIIGALVGRTRASLHERERLLAELQTTLGQVRTLRGLLPMCAWCKSIRDDAGYWQQVEAYIQTHTHARFTHGMCPECQRKVLAELDAEDQRKP